MTKDSEDKVRLRELCAKRVSAKGQITKFRNYLNGISQLTEINNIQLTELILKLSKFEALAVRVDDLQNELDVLNAENISTEIEEREVMECDITLSIATAKTLVETFSKVKEDEQRRNSVHNASCCTERHTQDAELKLPQIHIAKFDGSYFRWLEFRQTFQSLIHDNNRISPVNKFHYLNSYLQGDAARVISNLEVSTANYNEAWDLLCKRYNNKRMLIDHHLNALFNIKQFPRETEKCLRFLVDHVNKNLRALANLGQPTDSWDPLVIFMLKSKLDSSTSMRWEEHRKTIQSDTPTLNDFYSFLTDRADVLESCNNNNKQGHGSSNTKTFVSINNKNNKNNYKSNNFNRKLSCVICDLSHRIYDCPTFKSKSVEDRISDAKKYKLCFNCLRQGHADHECRMGPCRLCSQRHNSLLHNPSSISNHLCSVEEQGEVNVNYSMQNTSQVLLSTAMIEVSNPFNQLKIKVRALLDCGSQSSFISRYLKTKLCLTSNPIDALKVIGIGNTASSNAIESCNIQIKSIHNEFKVGLSCLVLKELTGYLPKYPIDIKSIQLPNNIQLADPKFNIPAPIDVLIGADLFWDLLGNEQRSLGVGTNNPKLRNSKLGWIVSGPIDSFSLLRNTYCNHAIIQQSDSNESIDNMLTKFWDLEEIPSSSSLNESEQYCEKHFMRNTTRDSFGRFCVKLPLRDSPDCLGDSYHLAKRRFINLEKRFKRNPLLKLEYKKFIQEYAELGHLSISTDDLSLKPKYFLCHHPVFKQESESTKLRVVFDGSAPSTSGYSLNDILMVGPNVQQSLFSILLRSRQYQYILTGDIEKMYRQVMSHESDRNLQLILWRDDESQPMQILKLCTVTYGLASSSYLSTRCLWQVGAEQDDDMIKTIIQSDFYIDDLITGSDDPQQLKYIQNAVSNALKLGCFNLRKYKSNFPTLFENLDINKQDNLTISESSSTLGLGWTPSSDTLNFPVKKFSYDDDSQAITKRFIMSNSFKIFDPLGLLSPVVIIPKLMLQRLWQQKIGWDDPVPTDIKADWNRFSNNLKLITDLQVPRRVLTNSPKCIELHSFSDASQSAYGACIYMRSISDNDDVTVRLLCAKSKVAPLKPTTIPRLELCGALLAAKLTQSVLKSLRYRPDNIIHWCDSSVVLGWINSDHTRLKVFVANRVSQIVELTDARAWRYVPTDSNPADLISRGLDAKHLISMNLWWTGPDFLLNKNESEWPVLNRNQSDRLLPELKSMSVLINESIINFDNYSSLNRLQRSLAFVQRFLFNTKNIKEKRVGILTADELQTAFHALCAIAQMQSFSIDYDALKKGKQLSNKSKILSLSPFLDSNNLIRVGGRLQASNCSFERKHPILLHASHRLTKLFFDREHVNNLHAGPQLLLAMVRETVWPINGRYLARRTVFNCIRCRRINAKTLCPKMGNLPQQRVTPDFPFLSVGIDFAGPFIIINRKGRGSRLIKCYLCLFVCLRYKCIHLEAVSDLTKDAFIMTLRRFIARRGKPTEIFSDNGTNFVAAAKEIGDFIKETQEPVSHFASQHAINYKFIPAYSPHFGGIWEAGVKSAKYHLKRVIGNSHLTFEEISTLFAQVEAILNSRPLCPLSSCPNDLLSLSPGHFIIGRPLTALPAPALDNYKEGSLKRYERLEQIRQHFWRRWQKEYLSEMQQRTKWRTNSANVKVGDMVLISEENTPPLQWRLGRVLRLINGPDNIPRVADVNTIRGCVRRSLVRLCPLPSAEDLQC